MSLYGRVLAGTFASLPAAIRQAHSFEREQRLAGRADVTCSETVAGKVLLRLLRLPRAGKDLPTSVVFRQNGDGEIWQRSFGEDGFSSHLAACSRRPGCILERKDGVSAVIRLEVAADHLRWQVESFRLFGFPLPRFLAPAIEAVERDISGRYHFEMTITLPGLGLFIAYKGWLEPQSA